jgi:hypothetical protein
MFEFVHAYFFGVDGVDVKREPIVFVGSRLVFNIFCHDGAELPDIFEVAVLSVIVTFVQAPAAEVL